MTDCWPLEARKGSMSQMYIYMNLNRSSGVIVVKFFLSNPEQLNEGIRLATET